MVLRDTLTLQFPLDNSGQLLAEFHAPLIEGIDLPEDTLHKKEGSGALSPPRNFASFRTGYPSIRLHPYHVYG